MKRRAKRALSKLTRSKLVQELCIRLVRCDSAIHRSAIRISDKSESLVSSSNVPIDEVYSQCEKDHHLPSDSCRISNSVDRTRERSDKSVDKSILDDSSNAAVESSAGLIHNFPVIIVPPVGHEDYENISDGNFAESDNRNILVDSFGSELLVSFPNIPPGEEFIRSEVEQLLPSQQLSEGCEISNPITGANKRLREDEISLSPKKKFKPSTVETTNVTTTSDSGELHCTGEHQDKTEEVYAKLIEAFGDNGDSDSEGSDYNDDTDYSISDDSGNESEGDSVRDSDKELEIYIQNFKKQKESMQNLHAMGIPVLMPPIQVDGCTKSPENMRGGDESILLPDLSAVSFFDNCQGNVDQASEGSGGMGQVPQPLMSSSRLEKDTNNTILDGIERSIQAFNDGGIQPSHHRVDVQQHQEQILIRKVANVLKADGKTCVRKRLTHFCKFCKKDCSKLKLHMMRKHLNEQEVIDMSNKCQSSEGKRDPMKALLHAGDLMYNKALITGIGIEDFITSNPGLRVARKPEKDDSLIDDYIPCAMCFAMFKEKDFRAHWRACSTLNCKRHRNSIQTGRKMFLYCHPLATQELKTRILSRMRKDRVFRAIRHDELIIHYGNRLCLHLRNEKDVKNIKTQMRRLGRLKIIMKVKNLSDALQKGSSERLVAAIEAMAADPTNPKKMKFPTVAQNMATLVKAVSHAFSYLCSKRGEGTLSAAVEHFIKMFADDYYHMLSHHARDSHRAAHAQKTEEVPTPQDVKDFYLFLCRLRKKNMDILEQSFDLEAFQELLEVTLISLIVYSRRRPGDVQYIERGHWKNNLRQTDEKSSRAFHTLPHHLKEVAKQMSMLYTRGKLGKIVKILVPPDVKDCINMIEKHRLVAGVHQDNFYLFGLPASTKKKIDYPKACYIMKKYAYASGCQQPSLLTATTLRKQLATECMLLNLNDAGTADLANFMSHHVDIHRRVYQQDVLAREIPIVLNFLSTALDIGDDIGGLNMNDLGAANLDPPDTNACNVDLQNTNEDSSVVGDKDYTMSKEQSSSGESEQASAFEEIQIPKTPAQKVSKKRWTAAEKQVAFACFKSYMSKEKNTVSNSEISAMLAGNPSLFQGRNHESIRTWLYGQRRKPNL